MKSNKKAILRMLEKQGDSLSVKQIRGSLGLEKAATAKLKAELLKLIKAGKIAKHGTRYQKYQEITERTGSKAKIKGNREKVKNELVWKQTPERRQRRSLGKTETGYFTRNPKGFGFVAIGGGRPDVFIGEHEQGFAMEGDLVEIEVFRKRG
ncbi:MAG: hypothetical protein VX967_01035, partial [SAR324 cluster bacterium]|nr:hypothetical protein [SAR324 cluster bacterium]